MCGDRGTTFLSVGKLFNFKYIAAAKDEVKISPCQQINHCTLLEPTSCEVSNYALPYKMRNIARSTMILLRVPLYKSQYNNLSNTLQFAGKLKGCPN